MWYAAFLGELKTGRAEPDALIINSNQPLLLMDIHKGI
jgi:hypothetical protein